MQFIEAVMQAAAQHNIACVLVGPQSASVPAQGFVPASTPEDDNEELLALRTQVQQLMTQLSDMSDVTAALQAQEHQVAVTGDNPGATAPQGADNDALDDASITTIGLCDAKLERKLVRLGYNTVGRLRAACVGGKLAEAKIKNAWLIDVGMKLAGASASASPSRSDGATGGAVDVPEGHEDRPWLERLAVARSKQSTLVELSAQLEIKQEEQEAYESEEDVPEEVSEQVFSIEEDIEKARAQLIALRWCLNLDPDPELTLDDALDAANLGPYKEHPTPRVLQQLRG